MNVNQILSCLTEEDLKDYKDNAIEMETFAGQSLDDIVVKLEKLRRQGKLNYYANFNGVKLYSLDVTMDSAFKECLNCTRKTWLKREKRWLEESKTQIEEWKKEAQEKLPTWIEEGKKYIHPEKFLNWEKTCIASANGDYSGLEVEKALEIMQMLEDGKLFKEIKEKVRNDGHSGMTYSKTMNIILLYANRGPALFKFMNRRYSYKEGKKYIKKIEEINRKLAMGYKYDEILESLKEHKIMDISVSLDLPEDCYEEYIEHYENYYKGTILIDEGNFFEGILGNDEYIAGQILENGCISLATFCNYKRPSHYYGINQDNKINARHEVYSISQGVTDVGKVRIGLSDFDKDYTDEIAIEEKIEELKSYFDEDIKGICDWFYRNFDSEFQRSISMIREGLNQRLVNAIGNQIEQKSLEENQGPILEKTRK